MAGKTTYSKRFEKVLHLDDFWPKCYDRILNRVAELDDVVIDGIYNTAEQRGTLIAHYKGESPKTCIWIDTPEEIIGDRHRRLGFHAIHRPFEPPTTDEGWDEIIRIEYGKE